MSGVEGATSDTFVGSKISKMIKIHVGFCVADRKERFKSEDLNCAHSDTLVNVLHCKRLYSLGGSFNEKKAHSKAKSILTKPVLAQRERKRLQKENDPCIYAATLIFYMRIYLLPLLISEILEFRLHKSYFAFMF